jgi:hypothetical protein
MAREELGLVVSEKWGGLRLSGNVKCVKNKTRATFRRGVNLSSYVTIIGNCDTEVKIT